MVFEIISFFFFARNFKRPLRFLFCLVFLIAAFARRSSSQILVRNARDDFPFPAISSDLATDGARHSNNSSISGNGIVVVAVVLLPSWVKNELVNANLHMVIAHGKRHMVIANGNSKW